MWLGCKNHAVVLAIEQRSQILNNIIMELYIEMYSEKSFAVFGETKAFKDTLKALNGKFNPNLKVRQGGYLD